MQTMRLIHVGLGNFGMGWVRLMHSLPEVEFLAAVDTNEGSFAQMQEFGVACYTGLEDAIAAVGKPDFVINATSPAGHLPVNKVAFAHNIPVLMEKPISEDFAQVQAMVEYARQGQKLMIAENYRYCMANIFVREQLQSRLRNISSVNLIYRQHHHMPDTNYHTHMQQPVMIDIGVHLVDLLRFFTGLEVQKVYAQASRPQWSWYKGLSNAKILGEMDGGVQLCYDTSMDSFAKTSWFGNWTFTAENGVAKYEYGRLTFNFGDGDEVVEIPPDEKGADKQRVFEEFKAFVKDGTVPQTDIFDQANNAAVIEAAIQSAESGLAVKVPLL